MEISLQQLANQVSTRPAHILNLANFHRLFAIFYVHHSVFVVNAVVWRLTRNHHEQNDASAPHVAFLRQFALEDLRSNIIWCSDRLIQLMLKLTFD